MGKLGSGSTAVQTRVLMHSAHDSDVKPENGGARLEHHRDAADVHESARRIALSRSTSECPCYTSMHIMVRPQLRPHR